MNKTQQRYTRPLSEKQKSFARELVKLRYDGKKLISPNLTQAAIAVGYSKKTAKQIASQLWKDERIKSMVDELGQQANQAAVLDRAAVLQLVRAAVSKAIAGYPVYINGKAVAVRIEPCAAPLLDILCKCTGSYAEEKISHEITSGSERFGIILNLEGKKDEKI